jgi:hypothetical protein
MEIYKPFHVAWGNPVGISAILNGFSFNDCTSHDALINMFSQEAVLQKLVGDFQIEGIPHDHGCLKRTILPFLADVLHHISISGPGRGIAEKQKHRGPYIGDDIRT